MPANDKYSLSVKASVLRQPISMQVSENQNIFSEVFSAFPESK